jgi:deazaflavin-dependent oxidoreductase (nitroreductase family)
VARSSNELRERLERYRQINLSVTGRKSGRTISRPVWFVAEDDTLYLLPVAGSDTQWYKNVVKNPRVGISARGEQAEFRVTTITHPEEVRDIVNKFRDKYGAADVKKYYSKFDVAAKAKL